MSINRRGFMHAAAVLGLAGLPIPGLSRMTGLPTKRTYHGVNLSGFKKVLGDGLYAAPGVPPPTVKDIKLQTYKTYSELRANIHVRRIMAHNIAYKPIQTRSALLYDHAAGYQFRIPYIPSTANVGLNGETCEGHVAVWDGAATRLDYITGWEWVVNPYNTAQYGDLRMWIGAAWVKVGQFMPDTNWHTISLHIDIPGQQATIGFDGNVFPGALTAMPRPGFGKDVTARLAAEAISMYPGPTNSGALHRMQVRNWSWIWTRN